MNFTNYAYVKICNTKNQGIVDEFCERILKNKKSMHMGEWYLDVYRDKHRDRCTFEWCVNPLVNDPSKLKLGPETGVFGMHANRKDFFLGIASGIASGIDDHQ